MEIPCASSQHMKKLEKWFMEVELNIPRCLTSTNVRCTPLT
jgi:hypothetical protein